VKTYCEHYECRCEVASELAWMAEVMNRPELLVKAVQVHSDEVRCRHVPRRGNPRAELPSERGLR
jgi:hypothetical protein